MAPSPPTVPTVLTRSVHYHSDGGLLLASLARDGLIAAADDAPGGPRPVDAVLLESADIATKTSRTTIAVLEASTRLTCTGETVTIEPLPQAAADGEAALARLRAALSECITSDVPALIDPPGGPHVEHSRCS